MATKKFKYERDEDGDWGYTDNGPDEEYYYYLCGEGVAEFFKIPKKVNRITIHLSKKPKQNSIKIQVECCSYERNRITINDRQHRTIPIGIIDHSWGLKKGDVRYLYIKYKRKAKCHTSTL